MHKIRVYKSKFVYYGIYISMGIGMMVMFFAGQSSRTKTHYNCPWVGGGRFFTLLGQSSLSSIFLKREKGDASADLLNSLILTCVFIIYIRILDSTINDIGAKETTLVLLQVCVSQALLCYIDIYTGPRTIVFYLQRICRISGNWEYRRGLGSVSSSHIFGGVRAVPFVFSTPIVRHPCVSRKSTTG